MLTARFPFFGTPASNNFNNASDGTKSDEVPSLKLHTDKEVYRPGDPVYVTIEVSNPSGAIPCPLLIERLAFEVKGIEKLDTQWFAAPKPLSGSRQRRGEYVFLDCSTPSIISNQIVSSGASKTYVVRAMLPTVLPPSYRGTTIRYLYYVKSSLSGRQLILENVRESTENAVELEARNPLQIWVTQKSNGLLLEESNNNGIVPTNTIQVDPYWKEMDGDSEWVKANDVDDGDEEGYDSSRDEILSASSYNPSTYNLHRSFGSSLSLQSTIARASYKDIRNLEGGRSSISAAAAPHRLSVAEILNDPIADIPSPAKAFTTESAIQQQKTQTDNDGTEESSSPGVGASDLAASEGFIRGRSYNIRANDQVLLRYSPKNSDSTYYFSDMIGGTLTFFHGEGARRCLEVSVSLETSETISRHFVHHSRKNSPMITKVQSDHHEVVADLVQTSFQFSIPMDGPMSFATPHVSVQWALRFEFFMTPENVDWTRYEHPLLVDGREKCEWFLPIIVHAPPPRTAANIQQEKLFPMDSLYHT